MSIADITELAKTNPLAAGTQLCVGLMAHDPSDPLRQGFTLGSALISTASLLSLTPNQMAVVAQQVVAPLLASAMLVVGDSPEALDKPGDLGENLTILRNVLVDFGVPS